MKKTNLSMRKALHGCFAFIICSLLALNVNAQVTKSLWVGETYTCDATSSTLGSITDVSWSSSGGYISLTGSGLYRTVTATQYWSGTASVTCSWRYTLYYGGKQERGSRTWYFTCTENPVSISPTNMEMIVGETRHVSYSHRYSNNYTSNAQAYFSCSSTCVSVSKDGTVTALKPGTAYINVYSKISNAANAPYCKVTVKEATPTGISLPNNLTVIIGQSQKITPTVYPSVADYSLSWSSSDESVATVSAGTVYGKKEGTARITAKISGYDLSDYCDVTVKKPTLTLKADPTGGLLEKDMRVTLTASNNAASIYYTLDGSTPNEKCQKYNAPISISKNLTLKAIACHPEYYDSKVLTVDYQVTSLKMVSSYPENGAENMGKNVTPSITFNADIVNGESWDGIKLTKNNGKEIKGEKKISGNTLYFVPEEDIRTGEYIVELPDYAVKGKDSSESNRKMSLSFSIKENAVYASSIRIHGGGVALVKTDGSLWTWGRGDTFLGTYKPTKNSQEDVVYATPGDDTMASITKDGKLWTWGNTDHGKLGRPSSGATFLGRSSEPTMEDVQSVAADAHMLVLKKDGTVWSCGYNYCGQLGNGEYNVWKDNPTLEKVAYLEDVIEVSADWQLSAAIKKDGTLCVWGRGYYLGLSDENSRIPYPEPIMSDVKQVGVGVGLALKNDHTLWSFRKRPFTKIMDNVAAISEGQAVLKTDGTLWVWGSNERGCLGNGTKSSQWLNPEDAVCVMDNVRMFAANNRGGHTDTAIVVEKNDGSIWAWGSNEFHTVGNNSSEDQLTPVKIIDGFTPIPLQDAKIKANTQRLTSLSIDEQLVFQSLLTPTNGDYQSMTWSIDDENIATISPRGVLTAKAAGTATVRLEVETEDNTFVCTQKVTVMDKPKAEDKTLEIAKYATFYDSQSAYTLPSGLTASVVTGVNNEKLTYKVIAEGGKSNNVIPKGVAVMLTSKKEGTSSYTLKPTDNDATYGNSNWLKGSDETTTTTADGNCLFYKLSYGPSNTNQSDVFGWYWGAANGNAFQIEGNKAWLAVPMSAGAPVRSFTMEDEATNIESLEKSTKTDDKYYDLQGRRIPKPTSKGIYIHQGKKYIIK